MLSTTLVSKILLVDAYFIIQSMDVILAKHLQIFFFAARHRSVIVIVQKLSMRITVIFLILFCLVHVHVAVKIFLLLFICLQQLIRGFDCLSPALRFSKRAYSLSCLLRARTDYFLPFPFRCRFTLPLSE
jgi:hypothetical protein